MPGFEGRKQDKKSAFPLAVTQCSLSEGKPVDAKELEM